MEIKEKIEEIVEKVKSDKAGDFLGGAMDKVKGLFGKK